MRHNRQPQRRQNELINGALAAGRSVVVDNTNPTVTDRAAIIAIGNPLAFDASAELRETRAFNSNPPSRPPLGLTAN